MVFASQKPCRIGTRRWERSPIFRESVRVPLADKKSVGKRQNPCINT
jgi:hypothetical protein